MPAQKPILLNANHLFVFHKIFVLFGQAQNILRPVKGQGITATLELISSNCASSSKKKEFIVNEKY